MIKRCPKCAQGKPYGEFDKNSAKSDGLQTQCRDCRRGNSRWSRIKSEYGIHRATFLEMERSQNGKCAICLQPPTDRYGVLVVDHCHDTGKVRGLLCRDCNCGIGRLKDDPEILQKALTYLSDA